MRSIIKAEPQLCKSRVTAPGGTTLAQLNLFDLLQHYIVHGLYECKTHIEEALQHWHAYKLAEVAHKQLGHRKTTSSGECQEAER